MIRELGPGAWCWFQDPRCVTDGENTYAGWVEPGGDVTIAQFDHARKHWSTNRGIDTIDHDDHGSPALHLRDDGRLLCMYMRHNDDRFRYRVTSDPADVSAFDAAAEFAIQGGGGNYPQFVDPPGSDTLYLFHRARGTAESRDWYCRTSSDQGETWSEASKVFEFPGEYSLYARFSHDGAERTDVAVTPHPRPNDSSLYHGYFEPATDSWYTSHGEPLDPPFAYTDLTCVWDRDARERDAWIWDVRTGGGTPELLYATIDAEDVQDHRYQHSRFENGSWETSTVVQTHQLVAQNDSFLEDHYSPGIYFDHQRPGECFLARNPDPRSYPDSDTRRGVELQRWRLGEGGEPAEKIESVTSESETNQFRPVTPVPRRAGQDSPVDVLWMHDQDGEIYTFDAFTTSIRTRTSQ